MSAGHYVCKRCGATSPMSDPRWRCACGGPLDPPAGGPFRRADVVESERSLWRYRSTLHGVTPRPLTAFSTGYTPLVKRVWAGLELGFKFEGAQPTGSFKDRGAAVLISHLASLGVDEIVEDSSGNGGAAIAAHAAANGMRCHLFLPADTSSEKIVQLEAYGAEVHRVPGSRQDTAVAAAAAAEGRVYASHNWQPMFIEGVKTLALELWEQRGFRAPDAVVVPASYGSSLLGLFRGFKELLAGGEIERLPRLYAVQAAAVAPLARFMADGVREVPPAQTVAEGIAGTAPVRLDEMAEAIAVTGGRVLTVPEDRIMPALLELGRVTGLYVEPTSAVAVAAAEDLALSGEIGPQSVVVLTGTGLKSTSKIGAYIAQDRGAAS